MWSLLLLSLFVGVGGSSYGCPTNVTCIEKETCCQTDAGLWACCPIEDGLCCDDGLHCCTKGQKCMPNGNCSSSTNQISAAFPLRSRQIELSTVPCPDGSACPDGNTCCQLSSGQYGCCPIADAVCCSDHLHCCPHGYTCDVEHSKCKKKIDELTDIPCPGGSSACPDGQTCCQLQSGDYGCCPTPDAVCCSDHLHCCPHGYTCNVEQGTCIQHISIPWLTKIPAIRPQQNVIKGEETHIFPLSPSLGSNADIICPDAVSSCPITSTCCLSSASIWGCCPIEKAVCCTDHQHCCPEHYKCDLHIFKCDHPIHGSIPMLKKQPALNTIPSKLILAPSSLSVIQCPDERSYCPEETTCCELGNGAYGCCPYADASCCSDKIHCCGNGYACDDSGKRCIRHFDSLNKTKTIPSSRKLMALKKMNKVESLHPLLALKEQTCPDTTTKCAPNATCCPNKQNGQISYSCCPYSKGVCCGSNGNVCCPNNYVCDEDQLSCELSDTNIFLRESPPDDNYNQCGSSDLACSYDQTCCRTLGSSDGEYACCGLANAQCCEDGRHCCPRGSRCDVKNGGCIQNY